MRCSGILKSARITFLKNIATAKNILALLLIFSTVHYVTRDLREVCETYSAGVHPFGLFLFTSTSYYTCFMYLFSYLLMICDAPFLDDIQTQVLLRTGRTKWALGQVIYIFVLNLFFWLFVLFSCFANAYPYIDLSLSWGRIFTSLASHTIFLTGFGAQAQIINNYTLLLAFLISFALQILMTFLLGLATFDINLATEKRIGITVPSAMLLFHFQFIGGFGFPYVLLKISPVSLANLMLLDPKKMGTFPTLRYAFLFFIVGNAALILLSTRIARGKSFCESRY